MSCPANSIRGIRQPAAGRVRVAGGGPGETFAATAPTDGSTRSSPTGGCRSPRAGARRAEVARASDHRPVLAEIDLESEPQCAVSEVGDINPVIQAASASEDDGCIGHTAEDDNVAGRRWAPENVMNF